VSDDADLAGTVRLSIIACSSSRGSIWSPSEGPLRSLIPGGDGEPTTGPGFSAGLGQMNMRVDMIDPGQGDEMMLAVGRCALGELDLFRSVQMIHGPNLDAVRGNDVHVLGNLTPTSADAPSVPRPPRSSWISTSGVSLISCVRSAAVLRSVSSSFTRVSLPTTASSARSSASMT
jgi:hypothetical protein